LVSESFCFRVGYCPNLSCQRITGLQQGYGFKFWSSYIKAVIFAALKQLIAIFLLLIVGLTTFTQCCMEDNCAQEQAAATPSSSEDGGDEGACSPFSSCTTCFGFTTQVPGIQVAELTPIKPQHRSLEQDSTLPTVSFSFWQPPKAGVTSC
jgi:hypothetical protein